MVTAKKSSTTKKPKVVGVEVLKKNGVDIDALVKQLITNASVEFTAYYYFTNLRMPISRYFYNRNQKPLFHSVSCMQLARIDLD